MATAEQGRRIALLVATDDHSDPTFRKLAAPTTDTEALADVLRNPHIGGYEVKVLINAPAAQVSRQIEETFTQAKRHDVIQCSKY